MKRLIFKKLFFVLYAIFSVINFVCADPNLKIEPDYDAPIVGSDKRFRNYVGELILGHLADSALIFAKTNANVGAYFSSPDLVNEWNAQSIPAEKSESLVITWLGHSTFLIQVNDINILTDPVFADLSAIYPRKTVVGVDPENLPKKIDVILISHNHRDHMDETSLKFLQKRSNPLCLVPQGDAALVKKFGFTKVKEFTWWQKYEMGETVLTFLPAIHWSNRTLLDLNKSLWGSWIIGTKKQNVYFGGDSAYGKHFEKIANKYPKIDVALLPVGPNGSEECHKSHMTALEAVQAFADLKARVFIPMHWGTFGLGTDSFDTPLILLKKGWKEKFEDNQDKKLEILKFGQSSSAFGDKLPVTLP